MPQDVPTGFYWLEKAAGQNVSSAQYLFGHAYRKGIHVRKNDRQAARWLEKAAQQGHVDAQFDAGMLYYLGQGVKKDEAKAFYWHSKAARSGLHEAQFALGVHYDTGQGVPKNAEKAVYWFSKAAQGNDRDALLLLGKHYYYGKGVAVNKRKAVELIRDAAKLGQRDAQLILGHIYETGNGRPKILHKPATGTHWQPTPVKKRPGTVKGTRQALVVFGRPPSPASPASRVRFFPGGLACGQSIKTPISGNGVLDCPLLFKERPHSADDRFSRTGR